MGVVLKFLKKKGARRVRERAPSGRGECPAAEQFEGSSAHLLEALEELERTRANQ